MAKVTDCSLPSGALTRPVYTAGAYLTAATCSLEQSYRLQALRRRNRNIHGWGVACGLLVVPAKDASNPWSVQVCPGYALGPYGDEIELTQRVVVNVEDYIWARGESSPRLFYSQLVAIVAIRYQDADDLLQPAQQTACECSEPQYRSTRTVDSYRLSVLWSAPPSPTPSGICQGESVPCPSCPDSPWLALAAVTLPSTASTPVTAAMIDNGIRKPI